MKKPSVPCVNHADRSAYNKSPDGRACKDCMFFCPGDVTNANSYGDCRVDAPAQCANASIRDLNEVSPDYWCGRFEGTRHFNERIDKQFKTISLLYYERLQDFF
ncbi:hypothetical protein V5F44_20575 [Xanthobacter sp. V2C-8]|uniref:hypothetical protein n=1 Tax=Xanthobacter albus TaxID=3119929 RepID=UPI0037297633